MSRVVLGVDLGKWQTPATIIALQTKSKAPVWDPVRLCWNQGPGINSVVCWVEAIPLGTSYDAVSRRIWEIAEKLGASEVWMDGTGVGVAVEEMVQQCKPPRLNPKTAVEALILHVGCPVRGNSGTGVQFFQVFHKLNIFKRIAAPSRISQAPQP